MEQPTTTYDLPPESAVDAKNFIMGSYFTKNAHIQRHTRDVACVSDTGGGRPPSPYQNVPQFSYTNAFPLGGGGGGFYEKLVCFIGGEKMMGRLRKLKGKKKKKILGSCYGF